MALSNQQKLDNVHEHISGGQQSTWMGRLAAVILNAPVKRRDGKETNLGTELSWGPTNFGNIRGDIAALRELVAQLAGAQGASIDYGKVGEASAKAIAAYVDTVEKTTTTINLKES